MKKITGLCIVISLTFSVAFGQQKSKTTTADPHFVISAADIAYVAVMYRNQAKECVSMTELSWLKLLRDADAQFSSSLVSSSGKQSLPLSATTYALRLCPCPPTYCPCGSDSTKGSTNYAALQGWNISTFELVGPKPKESNNKFDEVPGTGPNGITEYKLPSKLEDGEYTLIIFGTFGGYSKPEKFDLPVSIRKGKIYLLK